jgi:hypothetical protein
MWGGERKMRCDFEARFTCFLTRSYRSTLWRWWNYPKLPWPEMGKDLLFSLMSNEWRDWVLSNWLPVLIFDFFDYFGGDAGGDYTVGNVSIYKTESSNN